eukprot:5923049-Amphidinium_carterae.1
MAPARPWAVKNRVAHAPQLTCKNGKSFEGSDGGTCLLTEQQLLSRRYASMAFNRLQIVRPYGDQTSIKLLHQMTPQHGTCCSMTCCTMRVPSASVKRLKPHVQLPQFGRKALYDICFFLTLLLAL